MKVELNRQRGIKYYILALLAMFLINFFKEEIQTFSLPTLPETTSTVMPPTEVEEEKVEMIEEKVQVVEEQAEQPQTLEIDDSNHVKKQKLTSHQDFNDWIGGALGHSSTVHKQDKPVIIIERFGTPELLSFFFEAKLMRVMLHKRQLLHQVNQIRTSPRKLSIGGAGIQLTQKQLMQGSLNYLSAEEV